MTEEFKKMLEKAKKEAITNFEKQEQDKYKESKYVSDQILDMIYKLAKTYDYEHEDFDLDLFDAENLSIIGSPSEIETEIGTPAGKNYVSIRFYYAVSGELSSRQNRLVHEGLPWFLDGKVVDLDYLEHFLEENDVDIIDRPNEKCNCLEIEFDASILLDIDVFKLKHDTQQKVLSLNNKKKGNK